MFLDYFKGLFQDVLLFFEFGVFCFFLKTFCGIVCYVVKCCLFDWFFVEFFVMFFAFFGWCFLLNGWTCFAFFFLNFFWIFFDVFGWNLLGFICNFLNCCKLCVCFLSLFCVFLPSFFVSVSFWVFEFALDFLVCFCLAVVFWFRWYFLVFSERVRIFEICLKG